MFVSSTVNAQFEQRAESVGIDHRYMGSNPIVAGLALFDMNNDNLLDIFFAGGRENERLYINNGTTFDRVVTYLDVEDFEFYDLNVNSVSAGDLNNDGLTDLVLGTYDEESSFILLNKGTGRFDVVLPWVNQVWIPVWTSGASMGDINRDGMLDIFFHNYIDTARVEVDTVTGLVIHQHVGTRNNLFVNMGDSVFEDKTLEYGIELNGNTLASTFTDFDDDGDADIYVINDFGAFTIPNELYENQYPAASVSEIGELSNADVGIFGMGIAIGDYDGDLDLDYYMTNIGRNVLLRNEGNSAFTDVTWQAGVTDSASDLGRLVGWGTGFFDYDNDGDVDLYVSNGYLNAADEISSPTYNRNSLYRNNGDGSFTDVSDEMAFNDPSNYRGSAHGDLNNDGLLDVVMIQAHVSGSPLDTGLRDEVALYYNVTENDNNWVTFKLRGVQSNRSGYGARVLLYDNEGRVQVRECDGGSSFASANSPFIHFGIGQADGIDSVVIKWPLGLRQVVNDPSINQLNEITEAVSTETASQQALVELEMFPNPAANRLRLVLQGNHLPGGGNYIIYDIYGRQLVDGYWENDVFDLSLEMLQTGTYLLQLLQNNQIIALRKLIKID